MRRGLSFCLLLSWLLPLTLLAAPPTYYTPKSMGGLNVGLRAPNIKADSTLIVPVFSSAPSVSQARKGDVYYNSGDTTFYVCTGNAWRATGGAVSSLSASDGNPAVALSADAAGYITMPVQPACLVALATTVTDVTGDNTTYQMVWDTEVYDVGSNFSSTKWTAPVTGKYEVDVGLTAADLTTSHTTVTGFINTSNRRYLFGVANIGAVKDVNNQACYGQSILVDMDAGDTLAVSTTVTNGTKVVDMNANGATDIRCYLSVALKQ